MLSQAGGFTDVGQRRISVVIVDDHPLFREAVGRLLVEYHEFELVGEAGDGAQAIALATRLSPQVVVLDIALPKVNGIETTREIKARNPETAVVILSVYDDAEHVTAVLEAGANAYLTKDATRDELVGALRDVAEGKMFICQSALRHLVSSSAVKRKPCRGGDDFGLTARELETLQLLARGLSNREIAGELNLSTATVKGHLEGIYSKLSVGSRTEAIMAALRLGIVNLSDV